MEEKSMKELLELLKKFSDRYNELKSHLPYHVNVIDELHINENAHSRILCKLLLFRSDTGEYEILQSLIKYISRYNRAFDNIIIKSPEISQELERIDIWVRDKDGGYAIIFENKVYDANDQEAQIARYINKTRGHDFKDKQIYVVYMPSISDYEPSNQTWIDEKEGSLKDKFKERYAKVSFDEGILPWLKNDVLPNTRVKDAFLQSAISQYIDYLEGYFDKRDINKNMNMELNQFLDEELKINGDVSTEKKLETLTKKEGEIQKLLYFINKKKEEINNIVVIDKWRGLTKDTFKTIADEVAEILNKDGFQIESEISYDQETSALWIMLYQKGWDLSIVIAKYKHPDHSAFIYIGKQNEPTVDEKYCAGQKIFRYRSADERPSHPYGWEWIDIYHHNPNDFYNAIIDGSFKDYLRETVSTILEKIKEYNLSMN